MANNQSSNNIGSHDHGRNQQQVEAHGDNHWSITIESARSNIDSFIFILLTILQVMYQNDHNSPFMTHGRIMKIFIVLAFLYTSVLAVVSTLQIQYSHRTSMMRYLPVLNNFGLVLGAFVCDLLLLILFPPFGYFVLFLCILMLLILLLKAYQQMVELIRDVAKLASDGTKDFLRHVYEYYIYKCTDAKNYSVSESLTSQEGIEEGHVQIIRSDDETILCLFAGIN